MSAFFYRGPLPPDSPLFRGRKAELDRLTRLCQGEVQAYAIVYGGRQTGKTSLLLRLASELPESIQTCRVDMQRVPGATSSQIYGHLAQNVAQCITPEDQSRAIVSEGNIAGQIDPTILRRILAEYFDQEELRDLAFEMRIDYESLPAEGKSSKARELVSLCERRHRLGELERRSRQQRPEAPWPDQSGLASERSLASQSAFAGKIDNAPDLIRFLCQVLDRPELDRFVLLIEELGALPRSSQDDLANVLRSIFTCRFDSSCRSLAKLMVVLAGNIELYELVADKVSPLNNICEAMYLPDLSQQDAVGLVIDGLSEFCLQRLDVEVVGQEIYKYASGHPYLTQRLGAVLVESYATEQSLTSAQVDGAVEQLLCDDPLLHHLHKAAVEQHLLDACKSLLNKQPRFSRLDEEMARLELLGLIHEHEGYWTVRNCLLERALQEWIAVS